MNKVRLWNTETREFENQNNIFIGNEVIIIFNTNPLIVPLYISRTDDRYKLSLSIDKKDIHGQEIYEGDIVECYRWFDGYESKPKKKIRTVVTAEIESNMDTVSEAYVDGTWCVSAIEIVGHVFKESA